MSIAQIYPQIDYQIVCLNSSWRFCSFENEKQSYIGGMLLNWK